MKAKETAAKPASRKKTASTVSAPEPAPVKKKTPAKKAAPKEAQMEMAIPVESKPKTATKKSPAKATPATSARPAPAPASAPATSAPAPKKRTTTAKATAPAAPTPPPVVQEVPKRTRRIVAKPAAEKALDRPAEPTPVPAPAAVPPAPTPSPAQTEPRFPREDRPRRDRFQPRDRDRGQQQPQRDRGQQQPPRDQPAAGGQPPQQPREQQHGQPQHQGGGHGHQGHGNGGRRQGRFRRFSAGGRRFGPPQDRQERQSSEPGEDRIETEELPDPSLDKNYEPQYDEGIVEVSGKGFGFLRDPKRNFVQTPQDVFVTPEVVRRHLLRDGQWIKGEIRKGSRGLQLFRLTEVNGVDPEQFKNIPFFEELTTINPNERIKLETTPDRYTTRVMDLMTPIGKGQRGLIVAPPRTGKTTLLQHIGEAVVKNHPNMKLIILLVDERPEEVTEIRRTVPTAEIMASSNDNDVKSHTRIAQLAIERAKRLVECGQDVFILLDSITRMGRAFNNSMSNSGRTLSGGIDARAMEIPRRLFAAARNTEEAGSLTILGTALIETGSKADELIFQEFKGTGNMDLVLDRKISDQRIFPAVDIFQSGTRREELLVPQEELEKVNIIRRGLAGHKPIEAIERLLMFLKRFPSNIEMLRGIPGER